MTAALCKVLTVATRLILEPGAYCLSGPLDAPNGIEIRASGVSVDMRGHCILGPDDPKTTSAGILIVSGLQDVTVRGGCVSRFLYGIRGDDGPVRSSRIAVQEMRLLDNYFRGVGLVADHVTVTDNVVDGVRGTKVFDDAYAMGIEIRGVDAKVTRNLVQEIYPSGSGEGVGISSSDNVKMGGLFEGNTVVNRRLPESGRTFGLWIANSARVQNNVTVNHTYGLANPRFRTPGNTRNNIVVGEQCQSGYYSTSRLGLDTVFRPTLSQPPCLDLLPAAIKAMDPTNYHSVLRVAQLYQVHEDFPRAAAYYRVAANLGSAEAARLLRKLIAAGLVAPDE